MIRYEVANYVIIAVIVVLVSWGWFLSIQSHSYYELTFFDRLFGGNRYANVETYAEANPGQQASGILSRSFCASPEPRRLIDEESIPASESASHVPSRLPGVQ